MISTNRTVYKIVTVTLPVLAVVFYLLQNDIFGLVKSLPVCPFYATYHLYCPACGNTRSFYALFHGDLFTSLRYNIEPVILFIFIFGAYIELATYSFGRHIRILPRERWFYFIFFSILFVYIAIRNAFPYLTP